MIGNVMTQTVCPRSFKKEESLRAPNALIFGDEGVIKVIFINLSMAAQRMRPLHNVISRSNATRNLLLFFKIPHTPAAVRNDTIVHKSEMTNFKLYKALWILFGELPVLC